MLSFTSPLLPYTHRNAHHCVACSARPAEANADARSAMVALLAKRGARRTGDDSLIEALAVELEEVFEGDAHNSELLGSWKSVYLSRPGSASIIQRSVVGNVNFVPRVEQCLLDAEGGFEGKPAVLVNRADLRKILGAVLNVQARVESIEGKRLGIRFDEAWFYFDRFPVWAGGSMLDKPFRVPYPVPFRLLGSKAVGWLDVLYLDEGLRVSRGNRGSLFVLQKKKVDAGLMSPVGNRDILGAWVDED